MCSHIGTLESHPATNSRLQVALRNRVSDCGSVLNLSQSASAFPSAFMDLPRAGRRADAGREESRPRERDARPSFGARRPAAPARPSSSPPASRFRPVRPAHALRAALAALALLLAAGEAQAQTACSPPTLNQVGFVSGGGQLANGPDRPTGCARPTGSGVITVWWRFATTQPATAHVTTGYRVSGSGSDFGNLRVFTTDNGSRTISGLNPQNRYDVLVWPVSAAGSDVDGEYSIAYNVPARGHTVDGAALTLTFAEALDEGSVPAATAFTYSGTGGTSTGAGQVRIDGANVTLTLARAVRRGETVTVTYAKPASGPLRHADDNAEVAGFTTPVRNLTEAEWGAAPAGIAFAGVAPRDVMQRNGAGENVAGEDGAGDTYGLGDAVEVAVTFDRAVAVTGAPTLALRVGSATRQAAYARGSGSATLVFAYTVQAGDTDTDGVSVAAGSIALNGGTITRVADGTAATRSHGALAADDTRLVDGGANPPVLTRIAFAGTAPRGAADTYAAGDAIEVAATFDRAVSVTGAPTLALEVGSATREAAYASGSGSATLVFSYTVQAGDRDADGVSVPAAAVALNGGSIAGAAGAAALVAHGALAADPSRKVGFSDTTAPTVTGLTINTPAQSHGGRPTFFQGDVIRFTATFSETVFVTGTPQVQFGFGAGQASHHTNSKFAAYAGRSGFSTLLFDYEVQTGDLTPGVSQGIEILVAQNGMRWVRLNGGVIRDAAGNAYVPAGSDTNSNGVYITTNGVDGSQTGTIDNIGPRVTGLAFSGTAPHDTDGDGAGDTYAAGNAVSVAVTFSESVTVTGTPQLKLQVGAGAAKDAAYASGTGTATLVFSYTVQAGDADADGVSVPAGSIALNGGTLNDAANNGAIRAHDALAPDAARKVSGTADTTAPTLTGITTASFPPRLAGGHRTYFRDDVIRVTAPFSEPVTVDTTGGTPQVRLIFDSGTVHADYVGKDGASKLVFEYTVKSGDSDTNGMVRGNRVLLNGGAIRDAAGNAHVQSSAATSSTSSRVDGSQLGSDVAPVRAWVNGAALTVRFNEVLDPGSVPAPGAFTVSVAGSARAVTAVAIADADVMLTLAAPAGRGDAVEVFEYAPPAAGALQDAAGGQLAGFGRYPVANETTAEPKIASVALASAPGLDRKPDGAPDGTKETYGAGQRILVDVTWNEELTWDVSAADAGIRVDLRIGANTRPAELVRAGAARFRTRTLRFSYMVAADDADTDGVAVWPSADGRLVQLLGGATLKGEHRVDAEVAHPGLAADAGHLVHGGTDAPANGTPTFDGTDSDLDEGNAPVGTLVNRALAFSDPDDDPLTFTVSADRDVFVEGTLRYSAGRVWLHVTGDECALALAGLTSPAVVRVTVTASDPAGASVSVTVPFKFAFTCALAPTASTVGGADGKVVTLTYGVDLMPRSADHLYGLRQAFTMHGARDPGGERVVRESPRTVAVSGRTVTLTFTNGVVPGESGWLQYYPHLAERAAHGRPNAALRDTNGNKMMEFESLRVTRPAAATPVPRLLARGGAEVSGRELTLTFDRALDETSEPAGSRFRVHVTPDAYAPGAYIFGVGAADVDGTRVRVRLAAAVGQAALVEVLYRKGDDANPLRAAGGAPEAEDFVGINATVRDGTRPRRDGIVIAGTRVMVYYDEALDTASVPAPADFSVAVSSGTAPDVTGVAVDDTAVTLTLAGAVAGTPTVTVSYTPGTHPVRDLAGNPADSFSGERAAFRAADSGAPALVATAPAVADETVLTLTFNQPLDPAQVPATGAFSVSGGAFAHPVTSVAVIRGTVELGLGRWVAPCTSGLAVSYDPPGDETALRNLHRTEAPGFSGQAVENADAGRCVTLFSGMEAGAGGGGMRLRFGRGLSREPAPSPEGFRVTRGADTAAAQAARVSDDGTAVVLTLARALEDGERVTVRYSPPDGGAGLWDAEGNQVAPFTAEAVAGGTAAPAVAAVALASDPGADGIYGLGETIRVAATFDAAVEVAGAPRLAIRMDPGGGDEWAVYASGSGTAALVFAYSVVEPNLSEGGVAVVADSLETNGGTIRAAATGADAALSHAGLGHDPEHKVDWRQGPDPVALLSVADAAADEGGTLQFAVTLSQAAAETATVDYATSDGTATAGEDYAAASGTLTFAPGETEKTVAVEAHADAADEADETLALALSNAAGAGIADGEATGTVVEVAPLTAAFEGLPAAHDGARLFGFEIVFSEEFSGFRLTALEAGALAVENGRLVDAKRTTRDENRRVTVRVRPASDAAVRLTLAAPADCAAADAICAEDGRRLAAAVAATVAGPAPLPVVEAADAAADEGGTLEFAVTLSEAAAETATVDYATADGTAVAGEDYAAASGTLTFAPGETEKTVPVETLADAAAEDAETLALVLSNAAGAGLGDGEATGTVADVPAAPPPAAVAAALVSDAGPHGVYGRGAAIRAALTFDAAVAVDTAGGTPWVLLKFDRDPGHPRKTAAYESGSGTDTLVFAYDVAEPDHSSHGVALLGDTLALGGGAIRSADGGRDAVLSNPGLDHDAGHRIDSAPPTAESAAVDGNVLTVVFDEPLDAAAPPAGAAFSVNVRKGGSGSWHGISGAGSSAVDGAVVTVELERAVSWDETVRAYYNPDGADAARDLAGNAAHPFEGRRAENNTPRPNRPATGAPAIAGTAQVGETLTASADGIADEDGMDNAVLAWQWTSSSGGADEDITGATGPTYALAAADEGRTVRVRASFTDDAGFAETLVSEATEPVAARPLTARFEGVPEEHGGRAAEFEFALVFSDDFPGRFDYQALKDAFETDNGRVVGARRGAQGQNRNWAITVRPWSHETVSVSLPAGSVSTESGRPLASTVSATVAGPPGLSVADAKVKEGAGAVLAFAVTLSRAATNAFSVDYATSDGTAQAGADYTAASGTLSFQPGDSSKTIEVAVLDDAHDEGEETLTLRLSNASGAWLADGEATGTIENADLMPAALLARFSRAAAEQVVTTIEERMAAPRERGFRARLAGRELRSGSERDFAAGFLSQALGSLSQYARPMGMGAAGAAPMGGVAMGGAAPMGMGAHGAGAGMPGMGMPGTAGSMNMAGSVGMAGAGMPGLGGSTSMSGMPGLGGSTSMGGMGGLGGLGGAAGSTMGMTGQHAPMGGGAAMGAHGPAAGAYGGGLFGSMGMGGDLMGSSELELNRESRGGMLSLWSRSSRSHFTGLEDALSLNGDVRTTMFGADWARGPLTLGLSVGRTFGMGGYSGPSGGRMSTSMTGFYPWVGYQVNDRVSVWGVTGYGTGGLSLTPEGHAAMETGVSMAMSAVGTRGELIGSRATGGFALAFKADALWVGAASDLLDGAMGRLNASEAGVTRVRTALEGSRGYTLGGGRLSLTPSVEVGLRRDGGDAETGAGMDVGGGLAFTDTVTGLSLDVRVRTLVVHQAEGFTDRGMSLSLGWDPTPSSPLGLTAKVAPSWGGQAQGGAEALWGNQMTYPVGSQQMYGTGGQLNAEVGYGLPVGARFVGTPRVGLRSSQYGRDYQVGYGIGVLEQGKLNFELGVDAQRRESQAEGGASNGFMGRATLGW